MSVKVFLVRYLKRALKANREGKPAVVEFIVDGWDFAPGFKRFYERLS
jgi:hypothetical protein